MGYFRIRCSCGPYSILSHVKRLFPVHALHQMLTLRMEIHAQGNYQHKIIVGCTRNHRGRVQETDFENYEITHSKLLEKAIKLLFIDAE